MGQFYDGALRRLRGTARWQSGSIGRAVMETLEERRLLSVTTLTNGFGDGSLSVTVDAYGAYGSETIAGDALYNPFGPRGPAATTYLSAVYFGPLGDFLIEESSPWAPNGLESIEFTSTSSTEAVSEFELDGFSFVLTQRIQPITNQQTIFSQAYQITNDTDVLQQFNVVRHVDGDLWFAGWGDLGSATGDGLFVFQFELDANDRPIAYMGIRSTGAQNVGFTVQPFPYIDRIRAAGGIPAGDLNVINGDVSGDGFTDSLEDTTLSLADRITIAPGGTVTYTTFTVFGTGMPPGISLATVALSEPQYFVNEQDGSIAVTVQRTGSLDNAVSINYTTRDGTATAGLDYTAVSGTLTFASGQASRTITIPILDDDLVERDEHFEIVLFNVQGGRIGATSSAQIVIRDNDSPIRFGSPSFTVREDGQIATITVMRTSGTAGGVTIDFSTSNGTATAWEDYIPTTGTIEFGEGEMQKTFTIQVLEDDHWEPTETVMLTLSNPQGGAILGKPSIIPLNIINVDTIPPTISDVQMIPMRRGMGIGAVTITFSEPMHALRTSDARSYAILAPYNNDGRLGMGRMHLVRLSSVHYDEATQSVTLIPRKPLPPNRFYLLSVNGNIGPADRSENLLDGNGDGAAGGMYRVLFGRGNRLTYVDHGGSRVHLALFRGGVMEVFREFSGNAKTVSLHGTREGWSVLRGHVVGRGRTTVLEDLTGDEGIYNQMSPAITIASRT
jgi:hypothetical protein